MNTPSEENDVCKFGNEIGYETDDETNEIEDEMDDDNSSMDNSDASLYEEDSDINK